MLTACIVVVGDQNDGAVFQVLRMAGFPLARATRVAGCHQAQRCQTIRVFLALHDVDGRTQRRGHQLGQAVGHLARALNLVFPPFASGAALNKLLGLEALHLKQQCAVLGAVVIGCDDAGLDGLFCGGCDGAFHAVCDGLFCGSGKRLLLAPLR